ncbi:MAG: GntR family transcriptional regulator [Thermodesulfobacteriota bacterium]
MKEYFGFQVADLDPNLAAHLADIEERAPMRRAENEERESLLNLTSLREQVYQFLREEMQKGRLLPGSTINPTELSERLGISKTPLRDALIKLETEQFVTILPRRGVRVNDLRLRDIRNYYQIIGALEAGVIVEVFDQLGTAQIKEMRKLNAEMRAAVLSDSFDLYYYRNLEFHNVYLSLTDNDDLKRLITPMKQRLYDFPRRSYIKEWEMTNCDEHDRFIELLTRGDRHVAARHMRDVHWSFRVQEKYIRRFYSLVAEQIQAAHARAGKNSKLTE